MCCTATGSLTWHRRDQPIHRWMASMPSSPSTANTHQGCFCGGPARDLDDRPRLSDPPDKTRDRQELTVESDGSAPLIRRDTGLEPTAQIAYRRRDGQGAVPGARVPLVVGTGRSTRSPSPRRPGHTSPTTTATST